jgi:hypothetical protein
VFMSYRIEYYETFMGLRHLFIYNKSFVSIFILRTYRIVKYGDKTTKSGMGIAERYRGVYMFLGMRINRIIVLPNLVFNKKKFASYQSSDYG